jgi:hypothetical protein
MSDIIDSISSLNLRKYKNKIGKDLAKQIYTLITNHNREKVVEALHLLDTGMNNYDIQSAIKAINEALG